jgi:uncharacterized membrane protein YeaQ/YmgE (transglycosylase-associated protein family)
MLRDPAGVDKTLLMTASWPADSVFGSRYAGCIAMLVAGRPARDPAGEDTVMTLEPISLITLLLVGAIAGWLAGQIVRGYGFGLVGNIVVGIIGAVIGAWLLPKVGLVIGGGLIAWIINATLGAVILLFVIGLIKR